LVHFLSSNSRHGTHSPFVYALADTAVYRRQRDRPCRKKNVPEGFAPRYLPLLLDILVYLSVDELAEFSPETDAHALLADLNKASVAAIVETVAAGKIVIIHEPFKTDATGRLWQRTIQEKAVTVSINLFHFGLLIRRDGQRKEDFKLRYPFWRV